MKNIEILEKLTFCQNQIEKVKNERVLIYYQKKFNNLVSELKYYPIKYHYSSPQQIIDLMIEKLDLPKDFATSKKRNRDNYVFPRQKAMTLCRHVFKKNRSLGNIGAYFNGKDHATIWHSIKTVKQLCETDKNYRNEFYKLQILVLGSIEIKY